MPASSPANYGSSPLSAYIDASDLAALDARLKLYEPALRTSMRRRIRDAGKSSAEKVRSAAAAVGSVSIPPAVAVANSFTAKRQMITIKVVQSKLPGGHQAVARMVEGRRSGKGYRHPVYGHNVWVTQQPTPYFYKTLDNQALKGTLGAEITGAMRDATHAITEGT